MGGPLKRSDPPCATPLRRMRSQHACVALARVRWPACACCGPLSGNWLKKAQIVSAPSMSLFCGPSSSIASFQKMCVWKHSRHAVATAIDAIELAVVSCRAA